ncbi:MAG: DUF554 domain-containing protein [Bacteroidaceae bacterium]|nr:DUF554 domain-containing protein [Bacteroidaceae bacterium]
MLGTIVNTATIILGTSLGALLKKGVKPQYQEGLYNAMGFSAVALGLNAFVQHLPKSQYPVLFIVCLAVGSLIGYSLNLTGQFNTLVARRDDASGNGMPAGGKRLAEGLSTGILLYCVGTLSMLGPVVSALQGDNTYLFTNATLDFVTSMVLASTYGWGMLWAAPVLFLWQGAFYGVASLSAGAIQEELITELSIVGGILIFASGLSILGIKESKTLNMLPALFLPILYFLMRSMIYA